MNSFEISRTVFQNNVIFYIESAYNYVLAIRNTLYAEIRLSLIYRNDKSIYYYLEKQLPD